MYNMLGKNFFLFNYVEIATFLQMNHHGHKNNKHVYMFMLSLHEKVMESHH